MQPSFATDNSGDLPDTALSQASKLAKKKSDSLVVMQSRTSSKDSDPVPVYMTDGTIHVADDIESVQDTMEIVAWIHSVKADIFFGAWIMLNAVVMAIETDARNEENDAHVIWFCADSIFNVVFIAEVYLRLRSERKAWIWQPWNILDGVLVCVGVVDTWVLPLALSSTDGSLRLVTLMRMFRMLKLLRVVRLLRLLTYLKELMLLISGTIMAFRTTMWGFVLLSLVIFIFSMVLTRVVGQQCCDEGAFFRTPLMDELFGTMPKSAFTLFQFTMEFQPDLVRETWGDGIFLTFFLVCYTLFTNIMLMNMVVSVIVESVLSVAKESAENEKAEKESKEHIDFVRDLTIMFNDVDDDGSGQISWGEFASESHSTQLKKALKLAGLTRNAAQSLFKTLDVDESGSLGRQEFIQGFLRMRSPPQAKHILRVECRVDTVVRKVDNIADVLAHIVDHLAITSGQQHLTDGMAERALIDHQTMEDTLASPPLKGCELTSLAALAMERAGNGVHPEEMSSQDREAPHKQNLLGSCLEDERAMLEHLIHSSTAPSNGVHQTDAASLVLTSQAHVVEVADFGNSTDEIKSLDQRLDARKMLDQRLPSFPSAICTYTTEDFQWVSEAHVVEVADSGNSTDAIKSLDQRLDAKKMLDQRLPSFPSATPAAASTAPVANGHACTSLETLFEAEAGVTSPNSRITGRLIAAAVVKDGLVRPAAPASVKQSAWSRGSPTRSPTGLVLHEAYR